MRIIHLSSGAVDAGAGKGAYRLHLGLKQLGVESTFVGDNRAGLHDRNLVDISAWRPRLKRKLNVKLDRFYRLNTAGCSSQLFSSGMDKFNIFSSIDIGSYDIVHLHWINFGLGLDKIRKLSRKKRVVWTMRDMWPFTGGCHYSLNCEGYKIGCGACPALDSKDQYDKSTWLQNYKRKSFEGVEFVAISDWLKTHALSSRVVDHSQVRTIYNSVDTSIFHSNGQSKEYESLFKDTKPIVAIGALNLMDEYKGGTRLIEALNELKHDFNFVCFGRSADILMSYVPGAVYKNMGLLSEGELASLFASVDVFLMLSVQEAFGKTVIESISCGTPVVCFDNSGPGEVVNLLGADCGVAIRNINDVNSAVKRCVHLKKANVTAKLAREVDNVFSLKSISDQYLSLYRSII